jgi:hypothetical protein
MPGAPSSCATSAELVAPRGMTLARPIVRRIQLREGSDDRCTNPDSSPRPSPYVVCNGAVVAGQGSTRCIGAAYRNSPTGAFSPNGRALACWQRSGANVYDTIRRNCPCSHRSAGTGPATTTPATARTRTCGEAGSRSPRPVNPSPPAGLTSCGTGNAQLVHAPAVDTWRISFNAHAYGPHTRSGGTPAASPGATATPTSPLCSEVRLGTRTNRFARCKRLVRVPRTSSRPVVAVPCRRLVARRTPDALRRQHKT